MATISLKLPDQLDGRLATEARRLRTSKSALVRQCVEEMLRMNSGNNKSSCLALASDLAGCFDGPRDIATNPAYLDDFGV